MANESVQLTLFSDPGEQARPLNLHEFAAAAAVAARGTSQGNGSPAWEDLGGGVSGASDPTADPVDRLVAQGLSGPELVRTALANVRQSGK
jgi:hypothetical protein